MFFLPIYIYIYQIHGGTKEKDIIEFMATAEKQAKKNKEKKKDMEEEAKQKRMDTVVFFDEANTTDAIGLIKEIMCDRRIHGRPVSEDLKFIAACNPYRRFAWFHTACNSCFILYTHYFFFLQAFR